MTPVRGYFADNLTGNLDGTLAVANSPTGGVYPPGWMVQLFPNEVMVKREQGFNPVTKDWEFFELDVSKEGSMEGGCGKRADYTQCRHPLKSVHA